MLIIPLSRGSQLHRHTEAIGVVVEMRKLVFLWEYCARCLNLMFWGNIARGAGRKKIRVTSRVQWWCASRVRWCTGSGCLKLYVDTLPGHSSSLSVLSASIDDILACFRHSILSAMVDRL